MRSRLSGLSEEEAAREMRRLFGEDAAAKALILSRDAARAQSIADAGRWRRIARIVRETAPGGSYL